MNCPVIEKVSLLEKSCLLQQLSLLNSIHFFFFVFPRVILQEGILYMILLDDYVINNEIYIILVNYIKEPFRGILH